MRMPTDAQVEQLRKDSKTLYESGHDAAEIHGALGIARSTISHWKRAGNWSKHRHIIARSHREMPWLGKARRLFERGATVERLTELTRMSPNGLRDVARRFGWSSSKREAAVARLRGERALALFLECSRCREIRPGTAFSRTRGANDGTGGQRGICRKCQKATARRRGGSPTRAEFNARRAAVREEREAMIPRPDERASALRTLRALLGKLFVQRCGAEGLNPDAIEYRLRYQNDARFREREIARTWARKAAAGNLRTDGRTSRIVHDDGTLTPTVIQRLFSEATHCHYCGEELTPREKTLDHVVPVSRGGVHGISNAVIACSSCNSAKGMRTPDEWRQGQRISRRA